MYQYLPLVALAFPAFAQATTSPDYLNSIAQVLQGAGLTSFASIAARVANTSTAQNFLNILSTGNYTVFVPNNDAFSALPDSLSKDDDLLAEYLSYHIVPGNFSSSNGSLEALSYPNVTAGRTLLSNASLVNLEGNRSQVLVWTIIDGCVQVLNQPRNVTVQTSLAVENLLINVIDAVLSVPGNVTTTFITHNLTSLTGIFNATNTTGSDGTVASLAKVFDTEVKGFTLFAPNDQAVQSSSDELTAFAGNNTALATLLSNHVVNGTSLYSPSLGSSSQLVSAGGEILTVTTNSSGTFVTSTLTIGSASAKIVTSDVLTANGVIHIIDRVLLNMDTNPEVASNAYQSATQGAAMSATETGPISPAATDSNTSTVTPGNSGHSLLGGLKDIMRAALTATVGMIGWTAIGVSFM